MKSDLLCFGARILVSQVVIVLLGFSHASVRAAPGVLEIHHINVQQGDCTLIIGPDGTTLLIDAGFPGKGTAEVVPYLTNINILPEHDLDFMICTHRHSDHLGGLDEVISAGYDIKKGIWDNGSAATGTQINQFLTNGMQTTAGKNAGGVQPMPLGHVIDLGNGATATCVAVKGSVINHGAISGVSDENDRSVAMLVRFGDFEYITAGDLGGGDADRICTGRTTGQGDVETPLSFALLFSTPPLLSAHGVEVLHVNHHGSESSSNSDYINRLSPAVAVISTGPGQDSDWHHPRIDVVERVLMAQASACVQAAPALVLQTEEGAPDGAGRSEQGFCVGDVIIKTTGVGTFQVFATGEVSQGPDERVAAGIPASGRIFPLDGVTTLPSSGIVITEIMANAGSVADTAGEWFEIHNPGLAPIDINGWSIRDDGSNFHLIANNGPLLVAPGTFFVLGRNGDPTQNGGYHADYVYSGINLANLGDEIELLNASGQVVDRVAYTGTWPRKPGASIQLQNLSQDNNVAANWAVAQSRGGSYNTSGTDTGSPGK